MLHKDPFIVSADAFTLIQQLQAREALSGFFLVGGTALALQLGHRNSIDIDLFSEKEFQTDDLLEKLSGNFDIKVTVQKPKNTLLAEIDGVKTDFIYHPYQQLKTPISEDGISMLSSEDIAAMKLHAISNSRKRLKDFIDVYFLLQRFSLKEMMGFHEQKYPRINVLIPMRAITFFDDIDFSMDTPKMKSPITVQEVRERINMAFSFPKKKF